MSDKDSNFIPEKVFLVDFQMVRDQVETPEVFDVNKVDGHHLDNSLQFGFNFEQNLIKAILTIEISTDSKDLNRKEATGSFHLVFVYSVDNLKELAVPDNNNLINLNPALGNAIASVTYSTARGILMTRLKGTALQRFILPIVNPNKLLLTNA